MADVQHRVAELENEIKVLKNEIKAILLDIREQYLNSENPFNIGGQTGGQATASGISQFSIGATVDSGPTPNISPPVAGARPGPTAVIANPTIPEEATSTTDTIILNSTQPPTEEKPPQKVTVKQIIKKEASRPRDVLLLPSLEPGTEEEETLPKVMGRSKRGVSPLPSLGPDVEAEALPRAEGHGGKEAPRKRKGVLGRQNGGENGDGINLITIAGLSKWVDESTEKIGKERTEVMVEASYLVGHVSLELKDLLLKLVHLAQIDEPKKGKITTRDYLGVIAQLDSLLGYGSESEAALLTILADNKESK
jgi:hypothetical protein